MVDSEAKNSKVIFTLIIFNRNKTYVKNNSLIEKFSFIYYKKFIQVKNSRQIIMSKRFIVFNIYFWISGLKSKLKIFKWIKISHSSHL